MVPIGEKALLFRDPHTLEPEALRQIQNTVQHVLRQFINVKGD